MPVFRSGNKLTSETRAANGIKPLLKCHSGTKSQWYKEGNPLAEWSR